VTKKLFDRLKIVAVALSLAGAVSGCSKDASGSGSVADTDVGSIGFNLTLPNGAKVDPITYTITGPTSKMGTIPTSGSGNTFSVTIDGLKAGGGYTIMLNGKQDNGAADCYGTAMFEVKANQTTTVKVKMSCPGVRKGGMGSVMINGEINICAVVDTATGTPSGSTVALTSSASDEDMLPAAITYKWTGPSGSGTFTSDTAANTTYNCAVSGEVKLQLEVSDSDCGDKLEVPVQCTTGGPVAGQGAGGTGGTTGGAGGDVGGAGGTTGGTGGDAGGAGGAGGGGADACRACELADSFCGPRLMMLEESPKKALAESLLSCVRTKKCRLKGGPDAFALVDCWCGTTDFDACTGGSMPGNGDCKAEIEAASESTMAADISQRMADPAYAVGLVYQVLACDAQQCSPPICSL
jgi:hypothetical protein